MRIDKFLKVSRILKRRVVANEACDAGRVSINGRPVKASAEVKVGDIVEISFASGNVKIEILNITDSTKKADAADMYRIVEKQEENK